MRGAGGNFSPDIVSLMSIQQSQDLGLTILYLGEDARYDAEQSNVQLGAEAGGEALEEEPQRVEILHLGGQLTLLKMNSSLHY